MLLTPRRGVATTPQRSNKPYYVTTPIFYVNAGENYSEDALSNERSGVLAVDIGLVVTARKAIHVIPHTSGEKVQQALLCDHANLLRQCR
jgi:hypothetical protein